MAYIRIDLEGAPIDGQNVTFKAPCDCTVIDGIKAYYPEGEKVFTMKDAHGNALTGLGNLFLEGACVIVILDTVNSAAYLQNADTNSYLEEFMDHHRAGAYSVTLTAAGWTGSTEPFVQTVAVAGLEGAKNYMLTSLLSSDATLATQKSYSKAYGIIASGSAAVNDGSVTFRVYKKPEVDIVVGLKGV